MLDKAVLNKLYIFQILMNKKMFIYLPKKTNKYKRFRR